MRNQRSTVRLALALCLLGAAVAGATTEANSNPSDVQITVWNINWTTIILALISAFSATLTSVLTYRVGQVHKAVNSERSLMLAKNEEAIMTIAALKTEILSLTADKAALGADKAKLTQDAATKP